MPEPGLRKLTIAGSQITRCSDAWQMAVHAGARVHPGVSRFSPPWRPTLAGAHWVVRGDQQPDSCRGAAVLTSREVAEGWFACVCTADRARVFGGEINGLDPADRESTPPLGFRPDWNYERSRHVRKQARAGSAGVEALLCGGAGRLVAAVVGAAAFRGAAASRRS